MYSDGYSPTAYDNFVLYEKLFDQPCVILIDGTRIVDEDSAYYFHFYKWAIAPTWVDCETTPFMIFGSKGYIPQLEDRILDDTTREQLNSLGLNIYLYETLTFAKELVDRPNFNISKNSKLIDTIVNHYGKTMIFECSENEYDQILCYELESINKFAKQNNLTNVTVNTCHYNIEFIQDKYPDIKLKCRDLHLASMADFPKEEQYPTEQISNVTDLIDTKFACPNWRYHSTRHLVMSYLIDKPGNYSWYYKSQFDNLKNNLWFDLSTFPYYDKIKQGAELLNRSVPLEITENCKPTAINGSIDFLKYPTGSNGSPSDYRMDSAYLRSFCVIVTESFFALPTGIMSEKALNAIKLGRPFIMVAPPRTLEYMHKLGFQTFERFWDEDYDAEENHEQRLIKIFKVIDYINSMDIDQLRVWYSNMEDILKHNLTVIQHLKGRNNI
jgi:hypothetical protein